MPIYDFKQSKRTGYTRVPVPSSRVVIVEGIYALSTKIRWAFGLLRDFIGKDFVQPRWQCPSELLGNSLANSVTTWSDIVMRL